MEVKVTLSIGYAGACHEDIIEIDDADYNACLNEDQRQELLNELWNEWAWNYIDGGATIIEENE